MADLDVRDAALLLDMLLAAQDALSFVTDLDERAFLESRLHQAAIIRQLEIIGEAAGKVSPDVRGALLQIPWREIIGMRNRLIHGYADVEIDHVWAVVKSDLQPLITALEPLIPPPLQP